ncbi:ATP-dependent DNA helicase [Caerostris darwini]|uniref:ATP-dependent DNA helicase n=1 Tax=Caerostris darwini TaxID=1538125 RepID=A0AAV4S2B8_9ARAC|nr:ATP-dependent DNA helicase [Caerostris darwini]
MPFDKRAVTRLPAQSFKAHDLYNKRVSFAATMTRSQTAFNRVDNSKADMEFFSNGILHHPSSMPHVLVAMIGENGAIPRTTVTRSFANRLKVDSKLTKVLDNYIIAADTDPLIRELKKYQAEHNMRNQEPEENLTDDVKEELKEKVEQQSTGGESKQESEREELKQEPKREEPKPEPKIEEPKQKWKRKR